VLYGGGGGSAGSSQPVTIPAGSGSVTYNPNAPAVYAQPVAPSAGISTNTLLLLGLGAVALFLLVKK
jgi:hypothetical protein